MIVCIAEKPSVSRDIANLLGARQRYQGYLEGNGYQVTWAYGHLCTLKEPHDYHPEWKRWGLHNLPMIPQRFGIKAQENDGAQKQLEVIRSLLSTATMVINCGDAGQEGELIQRWILQYCACSVPVKRLWISSLTDEAIKEGLSKLRDSSDFDSLYEAGLARAIGDWLLGMNATRLYTTLYRQGGGGVLSIGRVQTPTLALIVQRQEEIDNFRPETFWELKTLYRGVSFTAEKGKYSDKAKAEEALRLVMNEPFVVGKLTKKAGKELPPRLFDLTSLQVACNKKFAMTAEETLAVIQTLYERKLTTYPRVDTTYLSEDIYDKSANILRGLVGYRTLTAPLLGEPKLRKSKKVFDNSKVTDHHAIIPTGEPVHGLSEREQKVFDLIALHFIACFYPDCEISTTTVLGAVQKLGFKASGREVLAPGWRVVFGANHDEEQENESKESEGDKPSTQTLPSFTTGESGTHTPELKERQTQPPKLYTEATLLRAMETAGKLVESEELREAMKENGIGRPSTRANIIETLFKRGYIAKEKRTSLKATDLGCQLIRTLSTDLLKSAELTGQWEYKLRQIERRELQTKDFLDELKTMVQTIIREGYASRYAPPSAPSAPAIQAVPQPPCPLCGQGYILRGRQSYGCSNYQGGCSYRISFEDYERQFRS